MENKKRISSNAQTVWLAFGKILALIATLAIPLVLTRLLNKEEYGFYNQFNTVVYFLSSFFSFGMFSNIYYFYPTLERGLKKSLLIHTLLFLIGFSALSGIFIYTPFISDFFIGTDDLQTYKLLIYLLTIILTLTSIIHPLYVVRKDIKISSWFPILQVVLKVVLVIGLFALIPSIDSILFGILTSSILVLFIVFAYLRNIIKNLPSGPIIKVKMAKEQFAYNLPIGAAVAIKTFSQRFDRILGITYLSVSSYASYSIAFFGVPGIQQIYDSISQVTVVDMVKCFNKGEISKAHGLYKNMVIKTLSFSVPIILIIALFAEEVIVFLFTKAYLDATPLFQVYLSSFFFVMLGAGLILRASGHTKYIIKAFIYSAVITIPATYFLIKDFGSMGAMIGALLSIILPKGFQFKKEIHITNSSFKLFLPWFQIGKIFFVSFISLIPFVFLKFYLPDERILLVIGSILMYLLIAFVVEFKLKIFILDQKQMRNLKYSFFEKIKF